MPVLNGLEVLKRIMREFPRPVIMVSSLTQEGAEVTLAIGTSTGGPKALQEILPQLPVICP
jgi:two-component system chemotaxis response regulator CheB